MDDRDLSQQKEGTSKRPRLSASLESKFGPIVNRSVDVDNAVDTKAGRSVSSDGRKKKVSFNTKSFSTDEDGSSDTNSLFDVLVSAAAQRKMSKDRKSSRFDPN